MTLQELRTSKNLTQEQVARRVGVTARTVSDWENRSSPRLEKVPALAAVYGMSTAELLMVLVPETAAV